MLQMYWYMSIDASEFMKWKASFQVNHDNQVRLWSFVQYIISMYMQLKR